MGRRRSAVAVAIGLAGVALPITAGTPAVAAEGGSPLAADSIGHREVVLEPAGDTYRIVSQTVRRADLAGADRGGRQGSGYRVRAKDRGGNTVTTVHAPDPAEVRFDVVGPDGTLRGGRVAGTSRKMVVRLPVGLDVTELEVTGPGPDVLVPLPAIAGEAAVVAPPSTTIMNNGPTSQRVDLVFVGDGYTAGQLARYSSDVTAAVSHLFSQEPFASYRSFFNVHRVDVVSNQSGTDDLCAGTFVDTALDTGFQSTGADCRLLWTTSPEKATAAAAGAPAADVVVVIVNTTRYGGAGQYGGIAVSSRGEHMGEVVAHEVGHSFGLLADEYTYGGQGSYPYPEPWQSNVTKVTVRAGIKWEPWIDGRFPVPSTLDIDEERVGLFEGAEYHTQGVYRPTYNSKMRELYQPFEAVNHQILVDRIFDFVPDDTSPPTGTATVASPGSVRLQFSDPQSYVHAYELATDPNFRNGYKVLASNTASFSRTVAYPTTATVFVRVTNGEGLTYTTNTDGLTAPGVPNAFTTAKSDVNRTATITWTPPTSNGGSSITGYRVARSAYGGQAAWSKTVDATARSQTFTYLVAGGSYTLSVEAINAYGRGPAAAGTVTIRGAPAAPVVGTASSGTSGAPVTATATWSPPSSDGGSPITGYRVRALRMSSTGTVLSTVTSAVLPATRRALVMTLPSLGNYRFTVEAINLLGTGPRSARSNLVAGR